MTRRKFFSFTYALMLVFFVVFICSGCGGGGGGSSENSREQPDTPQSFDVPPEPAPESPDKTLPDLPGPEHDIIPEPITPDVSPDVPVQPDSPDVTPTPEPTPTPDPEPIPTSPDVPPTPEPTPTPEPEPTPTPSPTRYTVTFDTDGGSEISSLKIKSGGTIEMPDPPTKDGYIFIAWYKDKSFNEEFTFGENGDKITKNITLYARWIEDNPDIFNAEYAISYASIGYAKGDNAGHVANDLTLTSEVNGVTINWSTSNSSIISISSSKGHVSRQPEDTKVTLTATATSGAETKSREFNLRVVKAHTRISADIEENTLSDIEAMNIDDDDFRIAYKENSGIVTDIEGKFSDILIENADDALDVIQSIHDVLGINNPYEELEAKVIISDSYSSQYSFIQIHEGMRVFGRGVTVSANASGDTNFIHSNFLNSLILDNADLNAALIAEQAEEAALNALNEYDSAGNFSVISDDTEKVIYSLYSNDVSPVYSYVVHVCGTDSSDNYIDGNVFIDASTGEIIYSMTNLYTDIVEREANDELGKPFKVPFDVENDNNGNASYLIYEPEIDMYVCRDADTIREGDVIKDMKHTTIYSPSSVSAYVNMREIIRWWRSDLFKRNSLDGNGGNVLVTTDVTGELHDNARWNGGWIEIGIKSIFSDRTHSCAVDLGILTHETTHAVMHNIIAVDFPYVNATGAINEGYADIFGCIMENNWLHGKKVFEGSTKYTCVRNIEEPGDPKAQRKGPVEIGGDRYVDYTKLLNYGYFKFYGIWNLNDNGGVHTNSLIISHAAYLMYKDGLSWPILAKIWYKSISGGYDADSDFSDVRRCVVKAAKDMYRPANEIAIIENAFDTVGIKDKYDTNPAPYNPDDIPIDEEHFPDENFRNYLRYYVDTDGNDALSEEERNVVETIDVSSMDITSLEGIQYFTDIWYLYCGRNQLTNINLSSNTKLRWLACGTNQLTNLDLSSNKSLRNLFCAYNQLISLDLSNNAGLWDLDCKNNQLTSLDVSNNKELSILYCENNQLKNLKLNTSALKYLFCYNNQLETLDLSDNTSLLELGCSRNQFSSLDVSHNTALTSLSCVGNQLTELDVSHNTELTELFCGSNMLTSLDLRSNTALQILNCYGNQLTGLDLKNNTALEGLHCDDNLLTDLNLSNNIALTGIDCENNQLTSLNLSNHPALEYLDCGRNQLGSLNLRGDSALATLYCNNNKLTNLDLTSCDSLQDVDLWFNQLTTLDLSNRTALIRLECRGNQLTNLNVSNDTALEYLHCGGNQLTNLDLSSNTALTELFCHDNQLTSLDLSNNIALEYLGCDVNQLTILDLSNCPLLNSSNVYCDPGVTVIYASPNVSASIAPANTAIVPAPEPSTQTSALSPMHSDIVAELPEFYADHTGTYTFSVSFDHEIPSGTTLTLEGVSGIYSFTDEHGNALDFPTSGSITHANLSAYFIEGRTYSPVIVAEHESNSGGCNINIYGVIMILLAGFVLVRMKRL